MSGTVANYNVSAMVRVELDYEEFLLDVDDAIGLRDELADAIKKVMA